jgi:DNA-binding transcriptional LysR family regulator
MDLRSRDLDLLVILSALLEERHVSRASQRLNLSQPTVSRALQRLRQQFSDPLLIRGPEGYELSQRAQQLEGRLHGVLSDISELYQVPDPEPEHFTGEIRISALDDMVALFLPRIESHFSQMAPGLTLNVTSIWGRGFTGLQSGAVDMSIEHAPPRGSGLQFEFLAETEWASVMSPSHPLANAPLSTESYLALRHGLVTVSGSGVGIVDDALAPLQKTRNVVLRLPFFGPVPAIVAESDIVFTMPAIVAEEMCRSERLILKSLPFHVPPITFGLIWHHRNTHNVIHRWARSAIIDLVRQRGANDHDG